MRSAAAATAALAMIVLAGAGAQAQEAAQAQETAPARRVEARSSDLLAVGIVQDGRMTVRLSRISDNAPVRDPALGVVLRGTDHPAVAEADGSYSIRTDDLRLPGSAAVRFEVTRGTDHEVLDGTLEPRARNGQSDAKGSTRQLGWWVLNFAVCIAFLWLWSRRKSARA